MNPLDPIPLFLVFLALVLIAGMAIEVGFRLSKWLRSSDEEQ